MSRTWQLPKWYTKAYVALVTEVFILIAVGGSVRVMNAGLACPDWPLCFGDVIPDYHPQVYFEFIHRVMAGLVAISTVVLQAFLFRSQAPRRIKWLGFAALVFLAAQIVFGALTVIWLLKSGVVATHLILATAFFSSLLWIYLSLKVPQAPVFRAPLWLKAFWIFLTSAIYLQILLGGLVASNFASLVCIDFPTCHGEWFPTFSGIIGLHVIHRLCAYCVFALITLNFFLVRKFAPSAQMKKLSAWLWLGVFAQVGLGIANVLLLTPPLIAVAHLAVGVTVLSISFRQLHAARGLTPENRVGAAGERAWPPESSFHSHIRV